MLDEAISVGTYGVAIVVVIVIIALLHLTNNREWTVIIIVSSKEINEKSLHINAIEYRNRSEKLISKMWLCEVPQKIQNTWDIVHNSRDEKKKKKKKRTRCWWNYLAIEISAIERAFQAAAQHLIKHDKEKEMKQPSTYVLVLYLVLYAIEWHRNLISFKFPSPSVT